MVYQFHITFANGLIFTCLGLCRIKCDLKVTLTSIPVYNNGEEKAMGSNHISTIFDCGIGLNFTN